MGTFLHLDKPYNANVMLVRDVSGNVLQNGYMNKTDKKANYPITVLLHCIGFPRF